MDADGQVAADDVTAVPAVLARETVAVIATTRARLRFSPAFFLVSANTLCSPSSSE